MNQTIKKPLLIMTMALPCTMHSAITTLPQATLGNEKGLWKNRLQKMTQPFIYLTQLYKRDLNSNILTITTMLGIRSITRSIDQK